MGVRADIAFHKKTQREFTAAWEAGDRLERKECGRLLRAWHPVGLRTGQCIERRTRPTTTEKNPIPAPVKLQQIYALEGGGFEVRTEGL